MNNYNNNNHMDSFDENGWCDLIDYGGLLDDFPPPPDLYWNPTQNAGVAMAMDASQVRECAERDCQRKRGRSDQCSGTGTGTKACRERMRREKLNERFSELSAILEPGRPTKSDKFAILGDTIRVLNQLKTESQEYEEMNAKLLEEIKTLKDEKNELREEKLVLKAEKEKIEQQLKMMAVPPPPTGFAPPYPPIYQAAPNKMTMLPNYGFVPMWHYLLQSARETAKDHELRPPAA